MREIKFRAWNKGLRRMSLVQELKFERRNNIVVHTKNSGGMNDVNFFIMQFTGLKDKNNKEIYEGDIVRVITDYFGKGIENDFIGKIIYCEERMMFEIDIIKINIGEGFSSSSDYEGELEVIGNIYENPELLEKK